MTELPNSSDSTHLEEFSKNLVASSEMIAAADVLAEAKAVPHAKVSILALFLRGKLEGPVYYSDFCLHVFNEHDYKLLLDVPGVVLNNTFYDEETETSVFSLCFVGCAEMYQLISSWG